MEFDKRDYATGSSFHNKLKLQMSAVIATVLARKVRVSLPDQSSLLLQSLGQFSEKSTDQTQACECQYLVVSEAPEKTMKSKSVLHNLSITNPQPTFLLTNTGGNSTAKNSPASLDNSVAAHMHRPSVTSASGSSVSENLSSPPTSVYSNVLPTVDSVLNMGSHIFSHFICHHHPHTDLSEAADYNVEDSEGKIVRPAALSSPLPSNEVSSVAVIQLDKSSGGFGILSRTYQFGAWLTKAASGDKMEVTKKDLNALAPNSF